MNLDNEQKLAALLRDALRGVNVTHSRFGTINPNHYRQMLRNYLKMASRHWRRNHRSAHASCSNPM